MLGQSWIQPLPSAVPYPVAAASQGLMEGKVRKADFWKGLEESLDLVGLVCKAPR